MNKERMLEAVRIALFKTIEANLFLDTHPNCRRAAAYFEAAGEEYRAALQAYENAFGPLRATSASGTRWNWIDTPWPWQMGV